MRLLALALLLLQQTVTGIVTLPVASSAYPGAYEVEHFDGGFTNPIWHTDNFGPLQWVPGFLNQAWGPTAASVGFTP